MKSWSSLVYRFPVLLEMSDISDVHIIDRAIAQRLALERKERIDAWKAKLNISDVAVRQWVLRPPPAAGSLDMPTGDFDRQSVVDREANFRIKLWSSPLSDYAFDKISRFATWIPQQGFPCDPSCVLVSGKDLKRKAEQHRRSSAGLDGWLPSVIAVLPVIWFNAVASIWNLCVSSDAILPESWSWVRVSFLPDFRPISVSVFMWRLCSSTVVTALRPWIRSWAPPQLFGGIPSCHSYMFLQQFAAAADSCRIAHKPFIGLKLELSKCYDRLHWPLLLDLVARLGLPSGLIRVLADFYEHRVCWFNFRGASKHRPFHPLCGILQGCPFSPLLLNALMACWCHMLSDLRIPSVAFGAYLDDRLLWVANHPHPARLLRRMFDCTLVFDRAVGGVLNFAKSYPFVRTAYWRARLRTIFVELAKPVTSFAILGVRFNMLSPHSVTSRMVLLRESVMQATWTLKRIALAVSVNRRPFFVQQLVLPRLLWAAPWNSLSLTMLTRLHRSLERTLLGAISPGRSEALVWSLRIGAAFAPEFVMDLELVRFIVAWIRSNVSVGIASASDLSILSATRLGACCARWHWLPVSNHCFRTPLGTLDLLFDSRRTIYQALEFAWLHDLWSRDLRLKRLQSSYCDQSKVIVLDPYRLALKVFDNSPSLLGAISDARYPYHRQSALFTWRARSHHCFIASDPPACWCGQPAPTLQHWLWRCPDLSLPSLLPWSRRTAFLQAYGLCTIPPPLPPPERLFDHDPILLRLRSIVSNLAQRLPLPIVAASDAGATFVCDFPVAGVGFAFLDPAMDFGAEVPGLDQRIYAAELYAAVMLIIAAHMCNVPLVLILDNHTVATQLQSLPLFRLPKFAFGYWHALHARLPLDLIVIWIPSHFKKPSWNPPSPWHSELCRSLNYRADRQASFALSAAVHRRFLSFLSAYAHSFHWTCAFLCRQMSAIIRYTGFFPF
eukprot:TRINITY_DN16181_c0_g3_i1.p1 TRINITY_DN16181_c0_g3~~TRINITY_DN16181_c0_g3_i1.p1  ORF type:complete len:952 (+),score=29.07 TRINITY_DN16181_c0_g3_i1:889-3744(+)